MLTRGRYNVWPAPATLAQRYTDVGFRGCRDHVGIPVIMRTEGWWTMHSPYLQTHITHWGPKTESLHMAAVSTFNPLTAKLFNLNFHPLEVVSR